jgi:hypothetical protein
VNWDWRCASIPRPADSTRLQTPYEGSYFGLLTKPGLVLALRLALAPPIRSRDGGKTWELAETGITASLTARPGTAGRTPAAVSHGGRSAAERRRRCALHRRSR